MCNLCSGRFRFQWKVVRENPTHEVTLFHVEELALPAVEYLYKNVVELLHNVLIVLIVGQPRSSLPRPHEGWIRFCFFV